MNETSGRSLAGRLEPRFFALLVVVVILGALPVHAAGKGAKPGGSHQPSDKDTFCEGTYALCIKAFCPGDAAKAAQAGHVDCICDVVKGWSMGPGTCASREPVQKDGHTHVISTYSNLYNDTHKTLFCQSQDTVWAWCYGAPCVVDPKDPTKAVCNCPVEKSPAKTLGGDCKQDACKSVWSAATPAADLFANKHFYDYMQKNHPKVPVNPPAPACPQ
jgi:hypothetical protein